MKRIRLILSCTLPLLTAAQSAHALQGGFSVAGRVGTLGIGPEVAVPVGSGITLRGGAGLLGFDLDMTGRFGLADHRTAKLFFPKAFLHPRRGFLPGGTARRRGPADQVGGPHLPDHARPRRHHRHRRRHLHRAGGWYPHYPARLGRDRAVPAGGLRVALGARAWLLRRYRGGDPPRRELLHDRHGRRRAARLPELPGTILSLRSRRCGMTLARGSTTGPS